jgi:hypothetical protein
MLPISQQELVHFILLAKRASYVGGGSHLLPYRLGSHDLQFTQGDWAYHDSYLGESDFIGEEIVYFQAKVVWGMNYFGRILRPDKITSAQAGAIIQQSLSRMYETGRFLGGFQYAVGEFTYKDTNEGDVEYFTGKEWIEFKGEVVYQLVYHGGIVND